MSSEEGSRCSQFSPYFTQENWLYRTEFLRHVLKAVESNKFHINEDTLNQLCKRVTELNAVEFDIFISTLFEFLIQWEEKRNFELLGLMVELFEVVLGIVPQPLKLEITEALTSIDSWHVKLFVCLELFGQPEMEFETRFSDSTLPLELYLHVKSNSLPPETLLNRIYCLKDDIIFKFCAIVLQEQFGISDLADFESELEEINEKVKVLKSKHGSKIIPRIRHVLSQELRADS